MIYLDNCATTSVKKEILEEMLPFFINEYGNPESNYYLLSENAKKAVNLARQRVSRLLNCNINEVTFNSGATEGNNTVLKGVADTFGFRGKHIITTQVEHSSVYETCKYLETKGFEVTYLPVDSNCQININDLKKSIRNDTILVSIMWVNNEVGSIFPIKEIGKICKERNVMFHTDATQAIGKIKINLKNYEGVNFITFSGHKIYGPKGVGVLICRSDSLRIPIKITPLLHGGDHENGFRAGTLAVPNIVGIGKACEMVVDMFDKNIKHLKLLDSEIIRILKNKFGNEIEFNNDFERVYGIINVRFKGINNQILLKSISNLVAASTGSACSNQKPSRTLLSMNYSEEVVSESVRLSFSPYLELSDTQVLLKL